jgi:hypothetical protein
MGMGTAPTEQGPALASSGAHASPSVQGTVTPPPLRKALWPAPVSVGFMAAQEPWDAAAFIQRCHIDATQQRALQLPQWRGGEDDGGASVPLVDDTPDEYAQLPLQVRLCVASRLLILPAASSLWLHPLTHAVTTSLSARWSAPYGSRQTFPRAAVWRQLRRETSNERTGTEQPVHGSARHLTTRQRPWWDGVGNSTTADVTQLSCVAGRSGVDV